MKKCISFILAFVFVIGICASTPITFSANAASVGDLTFELTEDGNSYIVTECAKSATGIIEVPSVYENKPVVIIDDWAFQDCRNITEIKLPDTILTIGIAAFKGCKNLTTINYPKSLVDAANSMFSECEKLTRITVPEGVKVIPGSMFDGATYLTEITLPATLVVIGDWAFRDCVGLTELKLSDSVKEIGVGAFQGCKNLTTINYPKSLIDAANSIFSDCEKLTRITVPEGVKVIPGSMFNGATYLTEITLPATLEVIGDWAFRDCVGLTELKLSDSVKEIGVGAFQGCKNLTTINYPKSLVDAANSMFSECEKLTSITVPEGVKVIPGSMFNGATYLTEITLPATLEVIGDWAFRDCVGLTELKLSDSVKEIGIGAFQGCKNLTTINYPKSLIDAANSMFSECEKLTSITIPEGVKTIPASMFWGATYLTEINIPVSLEIIDDWAFRDCTGLTEIKLPISLKEVHLGAFQGCTSLKTVTYQGFAKQWENIDISSSNEPLTSATIVCLDHTHSYKETILKQPTCTEKGEKAYVCECGYTYTGDIKALGHNYSKDFTIDKQPTYEKTGSKSRHCTRCDAKTDVTVIPKLVLGVPVVSQKNTAKGITVTWGAVENAEKYIVYQRVYNKTTKKYSGWKAIKTTTDLTYTDTTVKLGTKYSYTVKAVTGSVKSGIKATSGLTYNITPTVKVAVASNGVKVSWSTVANATGYTVYSSTYNPKTKKWSGWTNRGTVKTTSWTDTKVKSGTQYRYTIKAMNNKVGSTYNKNGAATLYLAQPTVKIANNASGVKVAWNKIAGATGYTIYRSEYVNGAWTSWKNMGTIKKNSTVSWVDKSANSGTQYRYTVRAINGKVASTYKASNTLLYLAQPKTTVKAVSNGVNVAWTQSTGAQGYTIYRMEYNAKTKKWSGWKNMGTAKPEKTNWTDKSAKKGVTYRYTVKAVNGKVASTYKASGNVKR